ncbi:hypothetical protein AAFF_G00068070 [Aldrovandia affinis]|uniref:Uncharacterized protein n=1 Tax=Aldrovandia affinis TaxID=143900 RepID=A0AAD7RZE0_9TELE|nr:hypothetical protein AAFF_G00068070 [Aldrovandia affinis]
MLGHVSQARRSLLFSCGRLLHNFYFPTRLFTIYRHICEKKTKRRARSGTEHRSDGGHWRSVELTKQGNVLSAGRRSSPLQLVSLQETTCAFVTGSASSARLRC